MFCSKDLQLDGRAEHQENLKAIKALQREAFNAEREIDCAKTKGDTLTAATEAGELQTLKQEMSKLEKDVRQRLNDLNVARAESLAAASSHGSFRGAV